MLFKSATFHALTMMRRESGLCLIVLLLRNLINKASIVIWPGTPLIAVDMS